MVVTPQIHRKLTDAEQQLKLKRRRATLKFIEAMRLRQATYDLLEIPTWKR